MLDISGANRSNGLNIRTVPSKDCRYNYLEMFVSFFAKMFSCCAIDYSMLATIFLK